MERVRMLLFAGDGDLYWLSEGGEKAHLHLPWGYVERGKCIARNAVLYALRRSFDGEEVTPQEIFLVPFFAPERSVTLRLPHLSEEDREGAFRFAWQREQQEGVFCGAVPNENREEWLLLGVDKSLGRSWEEALETLDCAIHIKPWSSFTREFIHDKERPYCFVGWEGLALFSPSGGAKSDVFSFDYRGSSEDNYSPMELDEILSERAEDSKAYEELKRKWAMCCMMGLSDFRKDIELKELECSSRMSRESMRRLSLSDSIFGIDPVDLPISFPSVERKSTRLTLPRMRDIVPLLLILGTLLGCFFHFQYRRNGPAPVASQETFSVKSSSLPGVISCTYKNVGGLVEGKALVRNDAAAKEFMRAISEELEEMEVKQDEVQEGISIEFSGTSRVVD